MNSPRSFRRAVSVGSDDGQRFRKGQAECGGKGAAFSSGGGAEIKRGSVSGSETERAPDGFRGVAGIRLKFKAWKRHDKTLSDSFPAMMHSAAPVK